MISPSKPVLILGVGFVLVIVIGGAFFVLGSRRHPPVQGTEVSPETPVADTQVAPVPDPQMLAAGERAVPASEANAPTEAEPSTSTNAEPVTAHDYRIANMRDWLAEVESGKAALPSRSLACLMCASIAEILDSQGRGVAREVGKRTAFPAPGEKRSVFVLNGTTYIFDDWEFPEYVRYQDLASSPGGAGSPSDESARSAVITDIVGRAHEALALTNSAPAKK